MHDLWNTPILRGSHVRLMPLARAHADALRTAASDGELWALRYTSVPGPQPGEAEAYIETALIQRDAARRDHAVHARLRSGKTYEVRVLSISREDDLALIRLVLPPGETVTALAVAFLPSISTAPWGMRRRASPTDMPPAFAIS